MQNKQDSCPWCHQDANGGYTMAQFANPKNVGDVTRLAFFAGTITAEINASALRKPVCLSFPINFCPICGRRFETEGEKQ